MLKRKKRKEQQIINTLSFWVLDLTDLGNHIFEIFILCSKYEVFSLKTFFKQYCSKHIAIDKNAPIILWQQKI